MGRHTAKGNKVVVGGRLDGLEGATSVILLGLLDVSHSRVGKIVGLVNLESLVVFVGLVIGSN